MKISIILISALLASAAISPRSGMQSAPQKTNNRQFSITIEVPPRIKAGNSILCTITLTNTGNKQIGFLNGVFGYVVDVRRGKNPARETDKGRESNRREGYVMSGITRFKRLSPGEKWMTTFAVNELFDMSQPGDYTVQLKRENVVSNFAAVTVTE